jgi:hypothetical protein
LPSDITVSQWHLKHREPADNAAHTANAIAADTGDMQTDLACNNNDDNDETLVTDDITPDLTAP